MRDTKFVKDYTEEDTYQPSHTAGFISRVSHQPLTAATYFADCVHDKLYVIPLKIYAESRDRFNCTVYEIIFSQLRFYSY